MYDLYGLGSSGIPLEYSADLRRLQQQQMIAQGLLQQSQEPDQTNQMAGGMVVPYSPFQGLNKVAQAYLGAKMMGKGNDGYKALGEKYTSDQNAAVDKVKSAMAPTAAVPIPMANANGVEGQMIERSPADKRAAAQEAMLSQFPSVRNYGTVVNSNLQADQTLAAQQDQQEKVLTDNRDARKQELEVKRLQAVQDRVDANTEADRRDKRDFEQAKILAQIGKSGADKPPAGFRYKKDGSGDLEATPGGPADQKQTTALSGRETVSNIVAGLRDNYNQLSEGGGITDSSKGALSNMAAGVASSDLGQMVGKMVGTGNQSTRNSIAMTRPLLLQAIMKATGMSAKQMDSNTELKLYLSTATDPKLDKAANKAALDKIESLYGLAAGGGAPPAPAAGGYDADKEKRYQEYKKSKGL